MKYTTKLALLFVFIVFMISSSLLVITDRSLFDLLFLSSLVLLMIGGMCFVLEGGIFNRTIVSFKRFYKKFTKLGQYLSEFDSDVDNDDLNFSFPFTNALLLSGSILFILSSLATLFYL